jgi:AmiR/NasT family two-component response regulator
MEMAPELRREVHQATGMVLVQLDTNATYAFFRLRAHAYSSGQTLQDVAHQVVTRRLDFRDLKE